MRTQCYFILFGADCRRTTDIGENSPSASLFMPRIIGLLQMDVQHLSGNPGVRQHPAVYNIHIMPHGAVSRQLIRSSSRCIAKQYHVASAYYPLRSNPISLLPGRGEQIQRVWLHRIQSAQDSLGYEAGLCTECTCSTSP